MVVHIRETRFAIDSHSRSEGPFSFYMYNIATHQRAGKFLGVVVQSSVSQGATLGTTVHTVHIVLPMAAEIATLRARSSTLSVLRTDSRMASSAARGAACGACNYGVTVACLSPAPDRALEIRRLPGDRGVGIRPRPRWIEVKLSLGRFLATEAALRAASMRNYYSANLSHLLILCQAVLAISSSFRYEHERQFECDLLILHLVVCAVLCHAAASMWLWFSHTPPRFPPLHIGPAGRACLRAEPRGPGHATR